jgi:uncharacterized phiE125 gp8 family phage protein
MMSMEMTEPPALPVPLAEVKAFLRIGTSEEDALLAGLVRGAAETCEAFTGRALVARDLAEILPATSAWTRLGAAPVLAIEGVAALDFYGEATALAAEAYAIDIDSAGDGWVRVTMPGAATRVRVAYSAGMAQDSGRLPEALRHGIVRLAAHLYTYRDHDPGAGAGARGAGPPASVTALWRPWRRLRLR